MRNCCCGIDIGLRVFCELLYRDVEVFVIGCVWYDFAVRCSSIVRDDLHRAGILGISELEPVLAISVEYSLAL